MLLPADNRQWLCLSGTKYQAHHGYSSKLCDFILFWEPRGGSLHVATLELKSGSFRAGSVGDQLQNGANVADLLLGAASAKFAPALIHNGIKTQETRKLKSLRIRLRSASELIQPIRSGQPTSSIDWG
ncbi:hypothetical protein [Micromonospora sp. NPDC000668]|uniref:hypothetical protein n=1 Tax=Micromonospora sp. NPDC000668 TaxID=3364219 RepID=UPI00367CA3C6